MWWPFATRGTRINAAVDVALPVDLLADFGVFATNSACIKLWIPEKLTQGLDTLSAAHGMSRPDVLRSVLFEHVYGRPALEQVKEWKRQRDAEEARHIAAVGRTMFSPKQAERQITARLLGKSVDDFKLWVPLPLKTELATLAKSESLGLSDYIRKTLVRILLGESFHHRWRAAVGKLPEEVWRFEQDQTV